VEAEAVSSGAKNGGAEDVSGHEVWGGLNALEAEAEEMAKGFDDERLGDAGHTFQQGVALTEDGDQDFLNDGGLAGDDAAQLAAGVVNELASGAKLR
jgi:hypothetical protein